MECGQGDRLQYDVVFCLKKLYLGCFNFQKGSRCKKEWIEGYLCSIIYSYSFGTI
jgi:hypothetical protein